MPILSKLMKIVSWILGFAIGGAIIAWVGISLLIGWGVNSDSRKAMAQFGGDRIEALIAMVDCQTCNPYDRTQAVWALGQLKDKRALPVLHKYYTGGPCNHFGQICQYELSKAIRWTEGKSFMLPQIWRALL
jgi:hypothetical protein